MNLDDGTLRRFRDAIARVLGLAFDPQRSIVLSEVLVRRAAAAGLGTDAYLRGLESGEPVRDELRALARELTVGETYFFRNIEQFRALIEVVLPARLSARTGGRPLQLLSVGCASGEEPYTLAMLLYEHVGTMAPWSVHALDVNPAALERARLGRYAGWSLRETSPASRARWFRESGSDVLLDERVRSAVTFEEHNLASEHPSLFRVPRFDVIFCRNVLMYLRPDLAARVVAGFANALLPGGHLFLGHAETLRGLSHDFRLCQSHGTFYYERRGAGAQSTHDTPELQGLAFVPADASVPLADASRSTDSWVETIARASQRIAALGSEPLTSDLRAPPTARPNADVTAGGWDLRAPLELLQRERFAEALAHVGALPASSSSDPNVLLLRAVLLTHSADFRRAEQACADLLQLDELHTGARYLLALCLEGRGDRAGAIEHDRAAVYLDPGFAMPRLHLGLLARRAGDREQARRELADAMLLLERDDDARLLLFGGGFRRETLVALCRAELLACGGGT